jgi:hypothetical protein
VLCCGSQEEETMRMRYVVAVAVLALGSMAAGCGDDPADQTRTYYYKGTNTTRSPDGQVTGMGETLLRRVFDGPNSQIIEHVITKDDQQGIQENTLTFAVTGATFKENTVGFTGNLTGEPWEWTEWTARGTLPNGLTVESTTTIDPDNVTVDMKFRKDDVLQFTVMHELTAVPQVDFEQTRAEWRPR